MRALGIALSLACTLWLGGCGALDAGGALAGFDAIVTIPVFGRATGDLVYSGVSGRDCSVVRLDQGLSYCKPRAGLPETPPFCTRSLGRVDCWADPSTLPGRPSPVGDTPPLTPEQAAHARARWPDL